MEKKESNLKEVFFVFFKMGCVAFGGPAVHIALMEAEIVTKRKWISESHFLDLVGATNIIPGPNSTEMTMHCGHERAGKAGLFVAGISFIFPAIIITALLAWAYMKYGGLPEVAPFIAGIKPVVIAIIAGAVLKLGKKALKSNELIILAVLTVIASFWFGEIAVMLSAGVIGTLYFQSKRKAQAENKKYLLPLLLVTGGNALVLKLSSLHIFWIFLKVGAILYGGGYVLFAYLDDALVSNGFLTTNQLMDAVAVGQFTPGPVLSTATFIGFQLNGFWGALTATTGIFLPSFLFVLLLNPWVPKMRKSVLMSSFLDAINCAAVAIMFSVSLKMSWFTLVDWQSIVLAIIAFAYTFGIKKANPIYTILGGAILGWILSFI
jgi:chromate transporter